MDSRPTSEIRSPEWVAMIFCPAKPLIMLDSARIAYGCKCVAGSSSASTGELCLLLSPV